MSSSSYYFNGELINPDEIICKVCGEESKKSSWPMCFGARCCGGCKNFFWKHHKIGNQYQCRHGGSCEITEVTRKRCQACRFKKCVAVGMRTASCPTINKPPTRVKEEPTCTERGSKDSLDDECYTTDDEEVIYRQFYPKKEIDESTIDYLDPVFKAAVIRQLEQEDDTPPAPPPVPSQPCDEIAEQIVLAHETSCNYTLPKRQLVTPRSCYIMTNRQKAWQMFSQEIDEDIQETLVYLTHFARLDELDKEDKALLLKGNYFPMLLLRWSRGFTDQGLLLSDGRLIDLPTLELIYGAQLLQQILEVAKKVSTLKDIEIAFFIAIMLCQPIPDYKFRNPWKVQEICRYYKSSAQYSVKISTYHHVILPLIAVLNSMKESHNQVLNFVRNQAYSLDLAPIFVDLFDIDRRQNIRMEDLMKNKNLWNNTIVID